MAVRIGGSARIIACLSAAIASAGALARPAPPVPATTRIFREVIECRGIAEAAARLACYDAKVSALDTAEKAGDVLVADRAQVRETGKSLFGFGALKLPIFGGRGEVETPKQIEAKITGLRSLGYGKWELILDNAMRWQLTEPVKFDPRVGQPVTIVTAAMGSFFVRVNNGRGIRGIRVQ